MCWKQFGRQNIQGRDRARSRLAGTNGPELEAVAGKGYRASAVSVAGIGWQGRQGINPNVHCAPALARIGLFRAAGAESLEDFGQLVAQEYGHDGRRRLMRAQAMVICGAGHGCPQKTAKLVHGANHGRTENQEYGIGVGCFARIKQAAQLAVAQGIVDMLARTVDAAEGLFVQQAFQAIMLGHIAQRGQIGRASCRERMSFLV